MSNVIDMNKRKIKRYEDIKHDPRVAEALQDLREYVENQGTGKTQLVRGIYQTAPIDTVQTTVVHPWEFGYQVKSTIDPGLFVRHVYIRLPGEQILDVPEGERSKIMAAVFESCIDKGNEFPSFELIADDCIKLTQHFAVTFWYERSPGIVTP